MRTWNFGSARNESSRVQAVLAQVVSSMGDESFSFAFLSQLNNLLPIGCWSIYETGNNQPVMFESAVTNVTIQLKEVGMHTCKVLFYRMNRSALPTPSPNALK